MKNTGLWTVPALVFAMSMFGAGLGCGETGGGTAGSGGAGGSGGAAGSEAPIITKVQWDWADPCEATTSAVTVTVFATDDDTDSVSLVYSGSVSDCTPAIESDVSILDCPSRDPDVRRSGTVTVTDPEDNSDTVTFGFFHCESDEVCQGGDPCE